MKTSCSILVLLVAVCCFTDCKTQANSKINTKADNHGNSLSRGETMPVSGLTERYWKLIELYGNKVVMNPKAHKEPHFILKDEDNRVTGNSGCNHFFGTYELKPGNRIRFSQIGVTRMACTESMDTEQSLLKVFKMTDHYAINGDTLVLSKTRMAPLARFVAIDKK